MTYAKLTSIGDMTHFGAPVTIVTKAGECIVILLEEEQCRLWSARLGAILAGIDNKPEAIVG